MRKWRGKRWYFGWTLVFIFFPGIINCEKQKRQIFREQLLPALGGKIPEEAFRTDRLALNRLNKEGITVVDGVILEARHVDKHPSHDRPKPEVIKVYATLDGRYTSPEGRYRYDQPRTVDTTYVIRKPAGSTVHNIGRPDYHHSPLYRPPVKAHGYSNYHRYLPITTKIQPQIYKPIIRPLILPAKEIFIPRFYGTSWNFPNDWSAHTFLDGVYHDNTPFNTHQIITDYEGFLNDFHDRRLRHSENLTLLNSIKKPLKNIKQTGNIKSVKQSASVPPITRALTTVPITGFSCQGRRGTFADIETNCQVFHECNGWTKTSSLCPAGTAYSENIKRCEWIDQVSCNT